MNNLEKKEILRFLKKIGVDTRFVSVIPPNILINNLRFSKFSRTKEELFKKNYPKMNVVRSTIFQKICSRTSKILGESLKPREIVLINKSSEPCDKTLSAVLEPYSRKYGIKIVEKEFNFKIGVNELNSIEEDFDVIALPLTLDHEVENILSQVFTGQKVDLKSFHKEMNNVKIIYPLINVPLEWICAWSKISDCKPGDCGLSPENELAHEFLLYLESVVPQVRENILKSGRFLVEDK